MAKQRIAFAIPRGVHPLDLMGPLHLMYEAVEHGAAIEYCLISPYPNELEVASSAGFGLTGMKSFRDFTPGSFDLIYIPGADGSLLQDAQYLLELRPFLTWMREQYEAGAVLASICTGALLIGEAGLLRGRSCTTHWKYLEVLKKRFPQAEVMTNRLFVHEGGIYTSAGVSSGIDLGLHLLEHSFGPAFAADIAREVVLYLRRSGDDPQLSVFMQYRNHLDDRVHRVQDYLIQHLDEAPSNDALAGLIFTSPRHLRRLFKETVGITIGQYQEQLRMEIAVQLLHDGEKVAAVTRRIGLRSANQLRALLQKNVGKLPSELRRG
jgi:transcriptional regulator GlxA family with amidase domain